MYGSQGSWYYEHVAGIRLADGAAGRGWRRIILDPSVLRPQGGGTAACALSGDAQLTSASARSATPLGFATIDWACDGLKGGLKLNATVPVGATAQLYLPSAFGSTVAEAGHTVFSDGKYVPGVAGLLAGRAQEGVFVLELLSGSYAFQVLDH